MLTHDICTVNAHPQYFHGWESQPCIIVIAVSILTHNIFLGEMLTHEKNYFTVNSHPYCFHSECSPVIFARRMLTHDIMHGWECSPMKILSRWIHSPMEILSRWECSPWKHCWGKNLTATICYHGECIHRENNMGENLTVNNIPQWMHSPCTISWVMLNSHPCIIVLRWAFSPMNIFLVNAHP